MTSSLILWEGFISLPSAFCKPPNYRPIEMNWTKQCIIPGNLRSWHLHSTWRLQGHNCHHAYMCSLGDHLRTLYQADNKKINDRIYQSGATGWTALINHPRIAVPFQKMRILIYSLVFTWIHWSLLHLGKPGWRSSSSLYIDISLPKD